MSMLTQVQTCWAKRWKIFPRFFLSKKMLRLAGCWLLRADLLGGMYISVGLTQYASSGGGRPDVHSGVHFDSYCDPNFIKMFF